jgi:hypothetical protein
LEETETRLKNDNNNDTKKNHKLNMYGSSLFKLKKAAYFFPQFPSVKNTKLLATNWWSF